MKNYKPLIDRITAQTGVIFRPASRVGLTKLEALGLPLPVLDFYSAYEPSKCVEGPVRLYPIRDILVENEDMIPGCYCSQHGYVVFAATYTGDTYCFDIRRVGQSEPSVVLISHEMISEKTTAEEFDRFAESVAQTLYEFLEQFVHGKVGG